jgi:ParB/RepB/Spo0J family partition protein
MQAEEIQFVDPADCLPTDDSDPGSWTDNEFLMASLEEDGQKVPVLLAPDVDRPGKFRYIDGHRRGNCLGRLRRTMKAIVLPTMPTEVERIEVKFATNVIRRQMPLEEIGLEASRFIELTGASQREAATRLKCSDATISRALNSLRRLPTEIRTDVNKLGPSVTSIIASLPSEEAMREAFDFATTPGADGRTPTRDQLMRRVGGLRGKKKPKAKKCRRLRLRVDDRRFEVELCPGDTPESLIEAFKAAIARLTRHKGLPLEAVVAALADKEPSAA